MIISNDNNEGYRILNRIIEELNPSSLTVLCDSNTKKYCLKYFLDASQINNINTIIIAPGEDNKTIDSLIEIWNNLLNFNIDRRGLFINLGGGVITDIGGFAASTFKRGVKFINVPTTLLAMVDASIGGKNGINYCGIKNIIGQISLPYSTLVDITYIKSLPENQILNGYAEMVKHALINSPEIWKIISQTGRSDFFSYKNILESIAIKQSFINEDMFEKGRRKILNFGHTFGHSIEALFNKHNKSIGHGIAVSAGMKIATILSYNLGLITKFTKNEIINFLSEQFPYVSIHEDDDPELLEYMKKDKKNLSCEYRFVLLKGVGQPVFDIPIDNLLLIKALDQYRRL